MCFRNAMASGKIYDRLDGNIILGWLNEYDAQRDEIVSSLSINEAHEQIITALECSTENISNI